MQTSPSAWCLTSALYQVGGLFVRRLARVLAVVALLGASLALFRTHVFICRGPASRSGAWSPPAA